MFEIHETYLSLRHHCRHIQLKCFTKITAAVPRYFLPNCGNFLNNKFATNIWLSVWGKGLAELELGILICWQLLLLSYIFIGPL